MLAPPFSGAPAERGHSLAGTSLLLLLELSASVLAAAPTLRGTMVRVVSAVLVLASIAMFAVCRRGANTEYNCNTFQTLGSGTVSDQNFETLLPGAISTVTG
jgi:hypothetical protein